MSELSFHNTPVAVEELGEYRVRVTLRHRLIGGARSRGES
jgi:hypothetical protein